MQLSDCAQQPAYKSRDIKWGGKGVQLYFVGGAVIPTHDPFGQLISARLAIWQTGQHGGYFVGRLAHLQTTSKPAVILQMNQPTCKPRSKIDAFFYSQLLFALPSNNLSATNLPTRNHLPADRRVRPLLNLRQNPKSIPLSPCGISVGFLSQYLTPQPFLC